MKKQKMIDLKIDRSKWVRGKGGRLLKERQYDGETVITGPEQGESELLNDRGRMCCLGFLADACDVPRHALSGVGNYSSLPDEEWDKLPELLRPSQGCGVDTKLHDRLTSANDDDQTRGKNRERRITALMAKAGVRVKFVGKTPK